VSLGELDGVFQRDIPRRLTPASPSSGEFQERTTNDFTALVCELSELWI
jgi:hypothetical protein